MKLSTLKGGTHRVWVTVPSDNGEPDEKIWVDYRPGELTLEINDALKSAVTAGFEQDVAEIILQPLLVDWDVDEDILNPDTGQPTGEVRHLTPLEGIKKVPLPFLGLVLQAISEDSLPNPQRGATSVAGLQLVEPQVPPQSGTPSSEQQTDSSVDPGNSLPNPQSG